MVQPHMLIVPKLRNSGLSKPNCIRNKEKVNSWYLSLWKVWLSPWGNLTRPARRGSSLCSSDTRLHAISPTCQARSCPQGLCTYYSLHLELSSYRSLPDSLPHFLQVSAQMSPPWCGLPATLFRAVTLSCPTTDHLLCLSLILFYFIELLIP